MKTVASGAKAVANAVKAPATRAVSTRPANSIPSAAPSPPAAICVKDTIANILLIKATDLDPVDGYICDPYVIFKVGAESYTSRVLPETIDPIWNEKFDIFIVKGKPMLLDVIIMDKAFDTTTAFIGRFRINLGKYTYDTTYEVRQDLDDDAGHIIFQVTLTDPLQLMKQEVCDLPSYTTLCYIRRRVSKRYGVCTWSGDSNDIGELMLIVYSARTVAPIYQEDKTNPFCVVQLVDKKVHTDMRQATINPVWNSLVRLKVSDLHGVLQVTILNGYSKQEFLGTIAFPVILAERCKMQWYPLKDEYLTTDTGGQILIEFDVIYHPIRAALSSFKEKSPRPAPLADTSLARETLTRNIKRIKALFNRYQMLKALLIKCFEWESIPLSVISFILFTWLTVTFQPHMVPWLVIGVFLVQYAAISFWYAVETPDPQKQEQPSSMSLTERFASLQEAAETMQNTLGKMASFGERIENMGTFCDPFVSRMAIFLLVIAGILVHIVHVRYWILLLLLWRYAVGFRRCMRGLGEKPDPSNKLLNFFDRTPDNFEREHYTMPQLPPRNITMLMPEVGYIRKAMALGKPS